MTVPLVCSRHVLAPKFGTWASVCHVPEAVALTVRDTPLDAPPGAGLTTVMVCVVEVAMSVDGITAVTCVVDSTVVGRLALSSWTIEPAINPVPVTVKVKLGPPVTTLTGLIVVIVGTGLTTFTGGLVASRTYPLFWNNRNSYVPSTAGAVTVQVRVVTPAPT